MGARGNLAVAVAIVVVVVCPNLRMSVGSSIKSKSVELEIPLLWGSLRVDEQNNVRPGADSTAARVFLSSNPLSCERLRRGAHLSSLLCSSILLLTSKCDSIGDVLNVLSSVDDEGRRETSPWSAPAPGA